MKTKLFILFAAIAFTFGTANVYADNDEGQGAGTTGSNQGTVTLNVELHPIQTLVVKGDQNTVNLVYNTEEDYLNGVSSSNTKHLKVTSTGGYVVNVQAVDFSNVSGYVDEDPAVMNKVNLTQIGLETTSSDNIGGQTFTPLSGLSNEDKTIVASALGSVGKEFDVKYSASGNNEYLLNNYVKGEVVKWQTTVTYTIAPQ